MRKFSPIEILLTIRLDKNPAVIEVEDLASRGISKPKEEDKSTRRLLLTPHMSLEEAACQIINFSPGKLPQFLEPTLVEMISNGIDLYLLKKRSSHASDNSEDFKQQNIKTPILQNSNQAHFSKAYASLSSQKQFDTILLEEQILRAQADEMRRNQAVEVLALNQSYGFETFGFITDRRKFTTIDAFSRYSEDAELMIVSHCSQLDDLFMRQKMNFQSLVLNIYEKFVSGALTSDIIICGPETPQLPATPPPPPLPKRSDDSLIDMELNNVVSQLKDMGFDDDRARCAALLGEKSLDRSLILLLENSEKITEELKSKPSFSTPPPQHQQQLIVDDNSRIRSKTFDESMKLKWSPKSFIESQFGETSSIALSNLKKINSWIDKAKSQFDDFIVDSPQSNASRESISRSEMSESFTVEFGSHVRQTHNLMIQVSNISPFLCWPTDEITRNAIHAQTCATLYSKNLTGLVVLLTPQDFGRYKLGKACNQELFEACRLSAELHFPDIETQLRLGEDSFIDSETGINRVKEGDFFVTKHSNLPGLHVIFHLITSVESIDGEISQRAPLVNGLRNVFRLATKNKVTTLILPIFISPEQVSKHESAPSSQIAILTSRALSKSSSLQALAQLASGSGRENVNGGISSNISYMPIGNKTINVNSTQALFIRRAETVLKTLKAHLLETGQLSKHLDEDEALATSGFTKFLIPSSLVRRADDVVWTTIIEMIRVIFRTV